MLIFFSLLVDADIEASLVDLLGFDNLEFVQKLIMNRQTIITNIYAQIDTKQVTQFCQILFILFSLYANKHPLYFSQTIRLHC